MFETPGLFEACTTGDVEAARRIIMADPACIHEVGPGIGSTPLIVAAHRGCLDIVTILIDAGANVEARERASNTTAVHWAAEGGHVPVLQRLLAAGSRLDVVDGWFELGPLGWATFVRWAERRWVDRPGATRLLRERGAALDSFSALALGDLAHVRNDARLGFVERGRSPLHAAVRGFPDAVEALLRAGADTAQPDDWGMSSAAEAYVTEGQNVPASAGDPSFALVMGQPLPRAMPGLLATAAERGLARGARDLLNLGVDPDEPVHTLQGELPAFATALHVAAEEGKIAVVNLLLAAGAYLDARAGGTGQTPLHRAVAGKRVEMVQRLLDAGADVTIHDEQFGATPAGWAKHLGADEIAALFGSRP